MELLQNEGGNGNNSSSFMRPHGFSGEAIGSGDDLNLEDILETHNLLELDKYEYQNRGRMIGGDQPIQSDRG